MVLQSDIYDSEVAARIAAGDEQAFAILYDLYAKKLYRFLYHMIKIHEVAEELVSDVFLKLWVGRHLVPEIKNMDGFLFTVARHKALDFLKLASRQTALQELVARRMAVDRIEDAEDRLLEGEYLEMVEAAINRLSPKRKQVFLLSREKGLTYQQIADELGLSPHTVKRTLSQALASIRGFLEGRMDTSSFLWIFFTL